MLSRSSDRHSFTLQAIFRNNKCCWDLQRLMLCTTLPIEAALIQAAAQMLVISYHDANNKNPSEKHNSKNHSLTRFICFGAVNKHTSDFGEYIRTVLQRQFFVGWVFLSSFFKKNSPKIQELLKMLLVPFFLCGFDSVGPSAHVVHPICWMLKLIFSVTCLILSCILLWLWILSFRIIGQG